MYILCHNGGAVTWCPSPSIEIHDSTGCSYCCGPWRNLMWWWNPNHKASSVCMDTSHKYAHKIRWCEHTASWRQSVDFCRRPNQQRKPGFCLVVWAWHEVLCFHIISLGRLSELIYWTINAKSKKFDMPTYIMLCSKWWIKQDLPWMRWFSTHGKYFSSLTVMFALSFGNWFPNYKQSKCSSFMFISLLNDISYFSLQAG